MALPPCGGRAIPLYCVVLAVIEAGNDLQQDRNGE